MTEYRAEQIREMAAVVARLDFVNVVRCRDCKYHEPMIVSYLDRPLSVCTALWCEGAEGDNPLVKSDGYCAWGERK